MKTLGFIVCSFESFSWCFEPQYCAFPCFPPFFALLDIHLSIILWIIFIVLFGYEQNTMESIMHRNEGVTFILYKLLHYEGLNYYFVPIP